MDIYNDFCEPSADAFLPDIDLEAVRGAPTRSLGVIMEKFYRLNFNASRLRQGIASVGLYFAPLTALRAGDRGRQSGVHGLPRYPGLRRIVCSNTSNVPLTTALLTHGVAILFLLWYVVRARSSRKASSIVEQANW